MYEVQINQTGRGNKVDSWAWAPEWLVFPLLNSVSICRHLCTWQQGLGIQIVDTHLDYQYTWVGFENCQHKSHFGSHRNRWIHFKSFLIDQKIFDELINKWNNGRREEASTLVISWARTHFLTEPPNRKNPARIQTALLYDGSLFSLSRLPSVTISDRHQSIPLKLPV